MQTFGVFGLGVRSVSSPLLSPPHRVVWLRERRVDITPQNTALHKDACLEREWRLLTFRTQDGKNGEEEEEEEKTVSPTAVRVISRSLLQGFLNPGDTFTALLFVKMSWWMMRANRGEHYHIGAKRYPVVQPLNVT